MVCPSFHTNYKLTHDVYGVKIERGNLIDAGTACSGTSDDAQKDGGSHTERRKTI